MRILITGGYGFVGGRIAQHLQLAGHQIVLGTRKETNSSDWLPYAEIVTTNWHDTHSLIKICYGIDVVIHAAGMNSQECAADPAAALEFNGLTTARLVAAAVRAGVKRFVYLSSAHVYASPLVDIITESTSPHNPHAYATSHLAGENALLSAKLSGEIEGIVLRLSNAFGAPAHMNVNCWMLLVNELCRQAVTSGKLVMRTDGLQQRDFITLQDVARCVEHVIELPAMACRDGLFNLGGGIGRSVYEMTQLVATRCGFVLGFIPNIERPLPITEESSKILKYSVAKLESTGFCLQGCYEYEIDATLSMCRKAFGGI